MENELVAGAVAALGEVNGWILGSGVRILLILAGAYLVQRTSHFFIERAVRRFVVSSHYKSKQAEKKREDTIILVLMGTLRVFVWLAAALVILSELGINIGPLLAAAGVAGLAVSFGAQSLIKDIIAGLFVLLENQYRVGDVACLDGTCGLVEDITLRETTLRDLDGTVHFIPNGSITKTSNLSKDFSRVNLNIGISYKTDLAHVMQVIDRVGKELAEDPEWQEHIIKAPAFVRVDDFADSAVVVKVLGETAPLKQWDVAGELRKRLKIAFDTEGIEIPFPQRVIHQAKE